MCHTCHWQAPMVPGEALAQGTGYNQPPAYPNENKNLQQPERAGFQPSYNTQTM